MCEFLFKDCCLLNQSQKFVKSEHFSTHFVRTEKLFVKSENSLNQSSLNQGSTVYTFINYIISCRRLQGKLFFFPLPILIEVLTLF